MPGQDIEWIAREILPYEPDVRRWLRRSSYAERDEDDIIQEAYYRIAKSNHEGALTNGRAYFFSVVKNLLIELIRRERIVRFESMAELEDLFLIDDAISVEQQMLDREELSLIMSILADVPARCRAVFMLRRLEGLSQRETAERLQISENIVEKESAAGIRHIGRALIAKAGHHGYLPRSKRRGAGSPVDR